jgi:hypothetical protein
MSWSLRDYRQGKDQRDGPESGPPPIDQVFSDDQPLPTYAEGLEDYDEESPSAFPGWGQKLLRSQGLWSEQQLDRFSWLMRRGIDAT